jgi:hypothetical protein
VTKEDLQDVTKTYEEMRDEILKLFSADTIMIGHGLNHDLISMKVRIMKHCIFYFIISIYKDGFKAIPMQILTYECPKANTPIFQKYISTYFKFN